MYHCFSRIFHLLFPSFYKILLVATQVRGAVIFPVNQYLQTQKTSGKDHECIRQFEKISFLTDTKMITHKFQMPSLIQRTRTCQITWTFSILPGSVIKKLLEKIDVHWKIRPIVKC